MSVIYQTTPTVQDQYSRNYMQLFDELQITAVSTLFQGLFAKPESKMLFSPDANDVDIDVVRAYEKIAALVPRGTISQKLGSLQKDVLTQRYSTFNRSFPLAEEEGSINANQLLNRLAGESPYERKDRRMRMKVLAARANQESIKRLVRLFELLASTSILTGKMPAILGTTDDELMYDFRRLATHIVTLAQTWNDAAHDICGDVYDAWKLGRVDGHVNIDFAIFGESTMNAYVNNTQIKTFADNLRYQLVNVGSNPVPANMAWMVELGAVPRGRLELPEGPVIWIFTYLDGYETDAGVWTEYMPKEQALFGSTSAETHRYFGPPERLPLDSQDRSNYRDWFGFNMDAPPMPPKIKGIGKVISPAMFYFDAYRAEDKKKIVARVQAAPIFAPIQTDAWVTILNAGSAVIPE